MTLAEAQQFALTTLKQLMEEKINARNVEVVVITPEDDMDGNPASAILFFFLNDFYISSRRKSRG